jgi:hypothetical protein
MSGSSDPRLAANARASREQLPDFKVVPAWWALFIFGGAFVRAGRKFGSDVAVTAITERQKARFLALRDTTRTITVTGDDPHGRRAPAADAYEQGGRKTMTNGEWEQTRREKQGGVMATLVQILTLGIAARPDAWQIEYKNRKTGKTVRAVGATETEAEDAAKRAIQTA